MIEALLILNANIVLPDRVLPSCNVFIKQDKIVEIGFSADEIPPGTAVLDAENGYLFAGFIDLHVHGGGGADFMDHTTTAFETAVKTHLQHGTTTLLPTAMSASKEDLIRFISTYHAFQKESFYAGMTAGLHLEGPYFSGATAKSSGAQPNDVLRLPDPNEIRELLKLANGDIVRWDAAPELPGSDDFARLMTENGILCAVGHSDATAAEAENGFKNGFSHITHFYNAVSAHRKRDQKVFAGIVEATYVNDDVTIELIGDGCHVAKEDFLLALKIKGAEKISVVTDAMRLAGTNLLKGKLGGLQNGVDCIVDDGVAKLPDLSSFAGSICTMDRALKVLCGDFGLSPSVVSVMMSLAPAKRIGLDDRKGSIEIGKDADFVVTDTDFNLKSVIQGGTIILNE